MTAITASPPRATLATAVALALLQAGCAGKPIIDDSPLVRAAVVTTDIRNSGFKGAFGSDTVQVVNTVDNVQRIDRRMEFTGSILSRVGGKQDSSEIVRLDRRVEWFLDNRKERYHECPLGGCTATSAYSLAGIAGEGAGGSAADGGLDGDQPGAGGAHRQCALTMTENRFEIVRTGRQRRINGFDAEQYRLEWVISMEDPDGNVARDRISSITWTTAGSGEVAEAVRMQRAFEQRYRTALDHPLPQSYYTMLSAETAEFVSRFLLAGMSEEELAELDGMITDAQPVEGFPVSTKVQWEGRNATCQAPPEDGSEGDGGGLDTSSFKGLPGAIGKSIAARDVDDRVEREKRRMDMAPYFSLHSEVKSIELGDVRQSRLSVPAAYKPDDRR